MCRRFHQYLQCTAWSAAARSPVGCSELSQLHQQPICYKLPSVVTFTFIYRLLIKILSSLLNGAMVYRECDA